ncbi:MAG: peptidylprolyl isomerase [Thermoguttaceae bacterium]
MKKFHALNWDWLSRRFSSGRKDRQPQRLRHIAFEPLENRCLLTAVSFSSLSDVTMSAGTTLFVALNSDSDETVTYSVSTSNSSSLSSTIMSQTNKSLRLTVDINGTSETMTFLLFDELSPATTAAIEALVETGYYDGLEIYRNGMDDDGNPFVIQGGNNPPTGAIKDVQDSFDEEFSSELQFTSAGILAMARSSSVGTSSTEFFITEEATRQLDYNYTIFGFQTTGYDVVETISQMENQASDSSIGYLEDPVTIVSAEIYIDTENGVLELRAADGVTGTFTVTVTASNGTDTPTTQTFTVTVEADASTSPDNPFDSSTPTAPTSVAYVSSTGDATDTTTLNNSSSDSVLQFLVTGVTSGNEVRILADGNVIGSATATGTSVTVTTDGSTTLTDGTHTITAIQVALDETVTVSEYNGTGYTDVSQTSDISSLTSASVELTVDATAPTFTFTPVTVAIAGTTYTCQATCDDSTAVYSLDASPSGMTIDSSTGAITWTPTTSQADATTVTVRVTDTAGNYAQSTYTISVLVNNTAPVLEAASPSLGTTDEDTAYTIAVATFINNGTGTTVITDENEDAVLGGIAVYEIAGGGTWEYSLDGGATYTTITSVSSSSALLLDKDTVLRYTPDGENGETASISYRAWDATSGTVGSVFDLTSDAASDTNSPVSSASDTATLTVTGLNDAPVLTAAAPSLGDTNPGTTTTISVATLVNNGSGTTTVTDVDDDATVGGIAITNLGGSGVWEYSLDGSTFVTITTVSESAALLLSATAELRYTAAEDASDTATVTYLAWDATSGTAGATADTTTNGGTTAFSLATDTASLTVNNAPVLTAAAPSMGSTDEDSSVTISLTELINFGDSTTTITDADSNDTVGGIALTAVTGNGTWAYSLDDGATYTDIGTVSEIAALLLPADTILRYTPDAENGETVTITYRAWDATSGTAGATADTTTNGDATAFSSSTDTATLTVTDTNDAPVLTSATPSLGTVVSTEATTITLIDTFLNNGSSSTIITDVDTDATLGGIALTAISGSGTWEYSLDGTTFTTISSVSESDALLLPSTASLRYTPSGDASESATITYRAWDATSGTAGSTADTTTNGGTTAFSTAIDTATLSVNDAPVLTAATPSLGSDVLGTAVTFTLADDLINVDGGSTVTDVDANDTVGGIAITAITGSGTWAYSLDGTTFTTISSVSASAALLLSADATLRYTPGDSTAESATITYRAWDATSGTAGETADTTTNGGATAFSSATDTASLTVGGGSISGYVYIDVNNDGSRTTSSGGTHTGLPGAVVKLYLSDDEGNWSLVASAVTGSDGSYSFDNLAAGDYKIVESQPTNYIDGIETVGTIDGTTSGTAGSDQFLLTLDAGESASEFNFGERGLTGSAISLRYLIYGRRSTSTIITEADAVPAVYLTGSVTTYSTTYTTGGSAASIAASDAAISDADSTMLVSMTVTITNLSDGASETLSVDVSDTDVASSYSNGVLTLTGAATLAVYEDLLAGITYSNTAVSPTAGARTIDIVVNDGVRDSATAVATVTVSVGDSTYSITADQSVLNASTATSASFTFANAVVGDTYEYTITSSGGDDSVTGSGTITSATQQITGIDVSSLADGTLTYSVTLTDTDDNTGGAVTATALLDQTAPTGYAIAVDDSDIDEDNETAVSFTFADAEVDATYTYTITSDGGTDSVTGTGTVASETNQITGIDVSSLADGTLTFSFTLTDTAGNSGAAVTATATLDRAAPSGYSITVDQSEIGASDADSTSFTFTGAEVNATYYYVVTTSGGDESVTGSGVILSASQQVTGIDVSSLSDGTLTYAVTLTDGLGNEGSTVTATATLDTEPPSGYSITAGTNEVDTSNAIVTGFTFSDAEVDATYTYTITSSGGGSVTGTGIVTSASQKVAGIDISSLVDGTLTYSVTLTDSVGNEGAAVTTTATLDRVVPSGYSITADQSEIDSSGATAVSFTFANAEVAATYTYTITSSGGVGSVTGSGTITSADQQVTGIDVSALADGTLTYSVTLTDSAGNEGVPAEATATLETGAPDGYTIEADQSVLGVSDATAASFTLDGAEIGATYVYTIVSSGGTDSVTGSGTITSADQQVTGIDVSALADGMLTYSVTLTDSVGNEGAAAMTTAALDRIAPAGYSIEADQSEIDSSGATAVSFTFANAEVAATYTYTITSSGGVGSVTGSGTITSADQQVTGIDVSALADGMLTYSVTLTDSVGNEGVAATTTAALDRIAPAGYSIEADQSEIDSSAATAVSFTFANAEVGATYTYTIVSSGGDGSVTGSGTITSADQQVTGIDVSALADGTLTYSVTLTDLAGNEGAAAEATATLEQALIVLDTVLRDTDSWLLT